MAAKRAKMKGIRSMDSCLSFLDVVMLRFLPTDSNQLRLHLFYAPPPCFLSIQLIRPPRSKRS